jgi:hypothetical protein
MPARDVCHCHRPADPDWPTSACCLAGSELAALVHACVRFEHQPSPLWLQLMVSEASTSLHQMPVASSTLLLKSLAALGHDPSSAWLGNYCRVMSERMHECSPADLVKVRRCCSGTAACDWCHSNTAACVSIDSDWE